MRLIRNRKGQWDLAVYINLTQFKHHADCTWDMFENAGVIEQLARQHQIQVCGRVEELGKSRAGTLFTVGHNLGLEQPGILNDLYLLGARLRGRYLAVYCCGSPEDRPEMHALVQRTHAAAIHTAHLEISLLAVRLVFEKLVEVVEAGGDWPPDLAIERAEQLMLADL